MLLSTELETKPGICPTTKTRQSWVQRMIHRRVHDTCCRCDPCSLNTHEAHKQTGTQTDRKPHLQGSLHCAAPSALRSRPWTDEQIDVHVTHMSAPGRLTLISASTKAGSVLQLPEAPLLIRLPMERLRRAPQPHVVLAPGAKVSLPGWPRGGPEGAEGTVRSRPRCKM